MRIAKSMTSVVAVVLVLLGLLGCVHGEAEQYTLVDRSLNIGAVAIADLGSRSATYQTTLIRRDGSQFLVRESFTNEKRVLMVELRAGRRTGTVVSIHQDLMAVDASGAPGWTGVKVLNSGIVIDDGIWDRVFEITDALPSPRPVSSRARLGTVVAVRTYKDHLAVGEHRMFSPTAPEAHVDPARLGTPPRCDELLEAGALARYAVVLADQRIIDVSLQGARGEGLTGTYKVLGTSEAIPLVGRRTGSNLALRSTAGEILFDGRRPGPLFAGTWVAPGQATVEAVLGCALW